jgi:WD40 repeat protein
MVTRWVRRIFALVSASLLLLLTTAGGAAAEAPIVLWVAPNPGMLATNASAAAWSPSGTTVATGLADRWMRLRNAGGTETVAILQPHRSGGVANLTFSNDSKYVAVGNQNGTGSFRIYTVSNGTFLGTLVATIDAMGILRFAPDAQLAGSPAGQAGWRTTEVTVFSVTGSGYDKVTTARNISPNGQLQTAATSKGAITIQRTLDGSIVRTLTSAGTRPAFSPDSSRIAYWTASPNAITVVRISDGAVLKTFNTPGGADGGVLPRFTPDGTRVVGSGYLPFLKPDGTWDQKGVIRFWNYSNGALLKTYDQQTSLGVTTPVVFKPGSGQFLYGRYDGAFVVATTPPA